MSVQVKVDGDALALACARAAHEANRAYAATLGDTSLAHWEDAPEWQRASCLKGVEGALAGNTPEQSHEAWLAHKRAEGWSFGPVKDEARKTHPCMRPYAELPPEQRAKDALYLSVVRATARALGHEAGPGTCTQRISNGQELDACGEPGVVSLGKANLCRTCAEARLGYLERLLSEVRKVLKS